MSSETYSATYRFRSNKVVFGMLKHELQQSGAMKREGEGVLVEYKGIEWGSEWNQPISPALQRLKTEDFPCLGFYPMCVKLRNDVFLYVNEEHIVAARLGIQD